jgi:hypothetical protein
MEIGIYSLCIRVYREFWLLMLNIVVDNNGECGIIVEGTRI